MTQVTFDVTAGAPVTATMSFVGVARFAAAVYEPISGAVDQWTLVKSLATDGLADDSATRDITFDAPLAGKTRLFFFEARMTSKGDPPADVSSAADFRQAGVTKGTAKEGGTINSVPLQIVVRALLKGI